MKVFAERLKDLRTSKGLTQKDLEKELEGKITASAIGWWETEKRIPKFDSVIIIAQYFGVSTDYLAGLED
ncbi:MAG: helix-turn-helix transcriptional regulator [Clostridia bacterium]|nr:helix-turn-helix transcriptional regulator [Clostridia bacterium]